MIGKQLRTPNENSKFLFASIALIAVIIALSSALVGSEQSQINLGMMAQTQAHDEYTGASTKMRIAFIELENRRSEPQAERSQTSRLTELATDYSKQRAAAEAWADTYSLAIRAHADASSAYRTAQTIAIIAIIAAALSLSLANRAAWFASLIICGLAVLQLGHIYFRNAHRLKPVMAQMERKQRSFQQLRASHAASREDEEALGRADPDRSIRDRLDATASGHKPDYGQEFSK